MSRPALAGRPDKDEKDFKSICLLFDGYVQKLNENSAMIKRLSDRDVGTERCPYLLPNDERDELDQLISDMRTAFNLASNPAIASKMKRLKEIISNAHDDNLKLRGESLLRKWAEAEVSFNNARSFTVQQIQERGVACFLHLSFHLIGIMGFLKRRFHPLARIVMVCDSRVVCFRYFRLASFILGQELASLYRNPIPRVNLTLPCFDCFDVCEKAPMPVVNVELTASERSFLRNRTLTFRLIFSRDFPRSPPQVFFIPALCHPNVDPVTGEMTMRTLSRMWSPIEFSLAHVFNAVDDLLCNPDMNSCCQMDFKGCDKAQCAQKMLFWLEKHALPPPRLNHQSLGTVCRELVVYLKEKAAMLRSQNAVIIQQIEEARNMNDETVSISTVALSPSSQNSSPSPHSGRSPARALTNIGKSQSLCDLRMLRAGGIISRTPRSAAAMLMNSSPSHRNLPTLRLAEPSLPDLHIQNEDPPVLPVDPRSPTLGIPRTPCETKPEPAQFARPAVHHRARHNPLTNKEYVPPKLDPIMPNLSNGLMIDILTYLTNTEVFRLSRVCSKWQALSQSEKDFGHIADAVRSEALRALQECCLLQKQNYRCQKKISLLAAMGEH